MPSGRSSSSTTAPQWHDARCRGRMVVEPTCLVMRGLFAAWAIFVPVMPNPNAIQRAKHFDRSLILFDA